MVRFKVSISTIDLLLYECFNSKMVRFKAAGAADDCKFGDSFNSKMVRFKVLFASIKIISSSVSIPKWCDLKFITL